MIYLSIADDLYVTATNIANEKVCESICFQSIWHTDYNIHCTVLQIKNQIYVTLITIATWYIFDEICLTILYKHIISVPVAAFPTNITIIKGNDLYVRLRDPTDEYETCQLIGPSRSENVDAINNTMYLETCGFIVKEVTLSDNGMWHIMYGRRIVYRASVNVTVIGNKIFIIIF